ncbi:hypothetical protein F2Q68_00040067 [Brassica cretica]|uniref:Rhodanese domain-containing protein n=1 Tax=Brassica cretica TaxID=69181 RepID=A0A8S9MKA4_BRACR|nr:hypothetical protein F2Q68_00040067 [Brassica cretica]
MLDGGCRSTEDVCLRSIVVSEYRSTGLVSGSTVVDRNRSMNRWCYRSMRSVFLCGLNAPSLQDLASCALRCRSMFKRGHRSIFFLQYRPMVELDGHLGSLPHLLCDPSIHPFLLIARLVRHIKQHLELGISTAFRNCCTTLQSTISHSIRLRSYPKVRLSDPSLFRAYQFGIRATQPGCESGERSLMASTELLSAGFTGVTDIAGGYVAWIENELPVEE